MFVNEHAERRVVTRLGWDAGLPIIDRLEQTAGEPGLVAYEVARAGNVTCDDGSNGDQVVAIARDGEVTTIMYRRSWNQPFTPAALGVARCCKL